MFRSYLTIALRNLRRQRKNSVINLAALTLGLVPVILILLYVQYELAFDRYHKNADRIYRVVRERTRVSGKEQSPVQPGILVPTMVDKLPEVVSATRLWKRRGEVEYEEKRFIERNLIHADPQIFQIFSFELLKGNPVTALAQPRSIVISEEMAHKYFGDEEPVGKALTLNARRLTVTGVLKQIPRQSHFLVDFLVPANLLSPISGITQSAGVTDPNSWNYGNFFVYFLLRDGADADELELKFPGFLETHSPKRNLDQVRYFFQPLTAIHLHSHLSTELLPNADIKMIYLYSSIALSLLLISCISYINLATVGSATRAKEVGVRKISGALRSQLIRQFLGESLVLTLAATAFAVLAVVLVLPSFNSFIEREIELGSLTKGSFLLWLCGVIGLVSVCSGSYPALVVSSFKPVAIFRSKLGSLRPSRFRTPMAVTQFAFSTLFILAALIVRNQLEFVRQKDMGYRKDQIVTLPLGGDLSDHVAAIKTELRRHPNVMGAASSYGLPNSIQRGGYETVFGQAGEVTIDFNRLDVDFGFIEIFEMEIVEGRNFSPEFPSDPTSAVIVNESAVRAAGWKSPLGKELAYDGILEGEVVGVVKDFHFLSLHQEIQPLYLHLAPEAEHDVLSVKIAAENQEETLEFLKATINRIYPDYEHNFTFFDQTFEQRYTVEQKLGRLFNVLAALAIGIACLGLFGMVSLTAEQRTKEIGIRKLLGAPVYRIVLLLSQDFAKVTLMGSIIAWPIAWYGANKWLQSQSTGFSFPWSVYKPWWQGFAYRAAIGWDVFFLSGSLVLAIALLTVGSQAIRTACVNPAESLRHE